MTKTFTQWMTWKAEHPRRRDLRRYMAHFSASARASRNVGKPYKGRNDNKRARDELDPFMLGRSSLNEQGDPFVDEHRVEGSGPGFGNNNNHQDNHSSRRQPHSSPGNNHVNSKSGNSGSQEYSNTAYELQFPKLPKARPEENQTTLSVIQNERTNPGCLTTPVQTRKGSHAKHHGRVADEPPANIPSSFLGEVVPCPAGQGTTKEPIEQDASNKWKGKQPTRCQN
ncbi:hypothetical protein K402DRAFT_449645 [Aulographum hederae CBS 113979]|uniref:Uncharacterized protein n=1 Tax=Aulographum hederae CBS 113979 TaxID=1176131 RepID=A0A6G1HGV3_9PEZI|nr:hypothetical protein K402DRAFT_449645 [Aulographum hederae CBS 113979]